MTTSRPLRRPLATTRPLPRTSRLPRQSPPRGRPTNRPSSRASRLTGTGSTRPNMAASGFPTRARTGSPTPTGSGSTPTTAGPSRPRYRGDGRSSTTAAGVSGPSWAGSGCLASPGHPPGSAGGRTPASRAGRHSRRAGSSSTGAGRGGWWWTGSTSPGLSRGSRCPEAKRAPSRTRPARCAGSPQRGLAGGRGPRAEALRRGQAAVTETASAQAAGARAGSIPGRIPTAASAPAAAFTVAASEAAAAASEAAAPSAAAPSEAVEASAAAPSEAVAASTAAEPSTAAAFTLPAAAERYPSFATSIELLQRARDVGQEPDGRGDPRLGLLLRPKPSPFRSPARVLKRSTFVDPGAPGSGREGPWVRSRSQQGAPPAETRSRNQVVVHLWSKIRSAARQPDSLRQFGLQFRRDGWSGRQDLNLRPPGPERGHTARTAWHPLPRLRTPKKGLGHQVQPVLTAQPMPPRATLCPRIW